MIELRSFARAYRRNSWQNMKLFLKNALHMDFGMKMLIEEFFRSVQDADPVPVSHREVLATARIVHHLFAQIARITEPRLFGNAR